MRETALSCAPPMQGTCYGMPMQLASRPVVDRANRQGGFYKIVSPVVFFGAQAQADSRPRALGSRRQEFAAGSGHQRALRQAVASTKTIRSASAF